MARILRRSHSFTCTPRVHSANGMNYTCLGLGLVLRLGSDVSVRVRVKVRSRIRDRVKVRNA